MRKIFILAVLSSLMLIACKKSEVHVVLETTKGDIELKLYNATPLHRDNFVKLVKECAYDSLLFHRDSASTLTGGVFSASPIEQMWYMELSV